MKNILIICRKELKGYFASPIAYLLMAFFALIFGFFFYSATRFLLMQTLRRIVIMGMRNSATTLAFMRSGRMIHSFRSMGGMPRPIICDCRLCMSRNRVAL